MKYKWRKQKPKKRNCGIIAVAIIANCSIKKAEEAIGKTGRTKTKDLQRGLRNLGYNCPSKLKRLKNRPELAIAKLKYPNSHNWHWVVIYKEKIFDGVYGDKNGNVKWDEGDKISSYLPIEKLTINEYYGILKL